MVEQKLALESRWGFLCFLVLDLNPSLNPRKPKCDSPFLGSENGSLVESPITLFDALVLDQHRGEQIESAPALDDWDLLEAAPCDWELEGAEWVLQYHYYIA